MGALQEEILDAATRCRTGSGQACICILPEQVPDFDVIVPEELRAKLSSLPLGFMSQKHGQQLENVLVELSRAGEGAQAVLLRITDDCFLQWLEELLATRPKGVIVSQTS